MKKLLLLLLTGASLPLHAQLTGGANQPEYTSYESSANVDMVNLLTGDFTYSMPLVHVPSPEGGFSMPIFYHSGITPDQEASWAGLGWNVNAGAISRGVVGFPDDAFDQTIAMVAKDKGYQMWSKNYILYKRSWDSEKGYSGEIDLLGLSGFSWDSEGVSNVKIAGGVNFGREGVSIDPVGVAGVALTVASMGTATAASVATNLAISAGTEVAVGIAFELASGPAQSAMKGFWYIKQDPGFFKTSYTAKLNYSSLQYGFGSLYLGSLKKSSLMLPYSLSAEPSVGALPRLYTANGLQKANRFGLILNISDKRSHSRIVGSDMHDGTIGALGYVSATGASSIAYDRYSVMGAGIEGSISPYRTDIGTLNNPTAYSSDKNRYNFIPFLEEGVDLQKVGFRYLGDVANQYTYQDYRLDQAIQGSGVLTSENASEKAIYHTLQDYRLLHKSNQMEDDRIGLKQGRLMQGRHIEWFSIAEINAGQGNGKVMNAKLPNQLSKVPSKAIAAFTITREDGFTYHYALPVFNYIETMFSGDVNNMTGTYTRTVQGGNELVAESELSSYVSQDLVRDKVSGAYVTTWLLTAVTGPDFVDRGTLGQFDGEDLGYWVSMDYGQFSDNYAWQIPYQGFINDGDRRYYTAGVRQSYYLEKISTRSHTALFIKEVRKDGRGAYGLLPDGSDVCSADALGQVARNNQPSSSLRLSEVVTLSNTDYQDFISQGFASNMASVPNAMTGNVLEIADISANQRTLLNEKALSRAVLVHDYTLSPNTLNSFNDPNNPPAVNASDIYAGKLGKLTLKSIQFYGAGTGKVAPDFEFSYSASNPSYHKEKRDRWGMYSGAAWGNDYPVSNSDAEKSSWHLYEIKTPLGSTIRVNYESDTYQNIGGRYLSAPLRGGDVRVSSIEVYDKGQRLSGTKYLYEEAVSLSSGCIAQDPNSSNLEAELYDYGGISVMYGQVATMNNWQPSNGSFLSKSVYYFFTPNKEEQVQINGTNNYNKIASFTYLGITGYITHQWYDITVQNGKLGKPKRIEYYGKNDRFLSRTEFNYTDKLPNCQGIFTESTWLSEFGQQTDGGDAYYNKLVRTTKRYLPFVLQQRIITNHQGLTEIQDLAFARDFITGQPISSSAVDEYGQRWTSTMELAYNQYAGMGPVLNGAGNKNMLAQVAGGYAFFESPTGNYLQQLPITQMSRAKTTQGQYGRPYYTATLQQALPMNYTSGMEMALLKDGLEVGKVSILSISANRLSVTLFSQTAYADNTTGYAIRVKKLPMKGASTSLWKHTWVYRGLDASGQFADVESVSNTYRTYRNYVWKANGVNADGTLADFVAFTWTGTNDSRWIDTGEKTKIDRHSKLLETRDMNGNYGAVKYSQQGDKPIASVANANYNEFFHTSFEYLTTGLGHSSTSVYEGEVFPGASLQATATLAMKPHTGYSMLKIPAGSNNWPAFYAKQKQENGKEVGIQPGRSYMASVWVHESSATASKINMQLVGVNTSGVAISITKSADFNNNEASIDGWRLLQVVLDVPSNYRSTQAGHCLKVYLSGGTSLDAYFDDFRMHPIDASMAAVVYDKKGRKWFTIAGNNLYAEAEYDEATGAIRSIYKETLVGRRKVAETETTYRRDFE